MITLLPLFIQVPFAHGIFVAKLLKSQKHQHLTVLNKVKTPFIHFF